MEIANQSYSWLASSPRLGASSISGANLFPEEYQCLPMERYVDAHMLTHSGRTLSTSTWRNTLERQERSGSFRADMLERIDGFRGLTENWDGQGAIAISEEVIENSIRLGSLLSRLPTIEVSPNPNGTVSFYFDLPDSCVELELGRTRYRATSMTRDQEMVASGVSGDVSDLIRMGAVAYVARGSRQSDSATPRAARMAASLHFCSNWREDLGLGEAA